MLVSHRIVQSGLSIHCSTALAGMLARDDEVVFEQGVRIVYTARTGRPSASSSPGTTAAGSPRNRCTRSSPLAGSSTAATVYARCTSSPTRAILSDMVGTSHSWGVGTGTTPAPSPRTSMRGVPQPPNDRRSIGSRS